MTGLKRLFLVWGLAACSWSWGQQTLTDDIDIHPDQARFVFVDIERFLVARDRIDHGADPETTLQREYLDPASPGLILFIEKYDLTARRLAKAMADHPSAYARLDDNLEALKAQQARFRALYTELAERIPDAVFPPTYFLVAAHRGIGSGSIAGPLISIEKDTPTSIASDLGATLIHEMVHMQQLAAQGEAYFDIFSGPGRTLLALSLREGAATFVSELITGGSPHKNLARDYLLQHEPALWAAFQTEMHGSETGDWLWRQPTDPAWPQDLGYAVGARMVESYYRQAEDPLKAMARIMAITDAAAFARESGYRP